MSCRRATDVHGGNVLDTLQSGLNHAALGPEFKINTPILSMLNRESFGGNTHEIRLCTD